MDHPRLSTRHIVNTLGISDEIVENNLRNKLVKTKVPDQKRSRLTISPENLHLFEADLVEQFPTICDH